MARSLIVLPDDSARPILDAINQWTSLLQHQDVHILRPGYFAGGDGARKRGMSVEVMLNPARRSGESQNEQT